MGLTLSVSPAGGGGVFIDGIRALAVGFARRYRAYLGLWAYGAGRRAGAGLNAPDPSVATTRLTHAGTGSFLLASVFMALLLIPIIAKRSRKGPVGAAGDLGIVLQGDEVTSKRILCRATSS